MIALLLPTGLFAEEATSAQSRLAIADGTDVHLRLTQTVSSLNARVGDPLSFLVEKNVSVEGVTVIPAGSIARGSILSVKRKRIFGIGGKIVYGVNLIALATGETVGLSARRVVKGPPHTWRMVAEIAASTVFYLPAAPLFLLTRGGDSTVLKGTEVTAKIDCDASVQSVGLPSAEPSANGIDVVMANLAPRVVNREGREGDMVNLIFVAQKDDLQGAFARAGWVKTDPWKPIMAWHLLTRRMRDAKLPMARFFMFGRVQDYAYARPDPNAIVSRRHHIRIWKTQYTVDGNPIWAGSATYDQTIEFAKHGRIINHTIDPQVDTERDFVGTNIAETSTLRKQYLHPENPVFEAQTTSGQAYQSDSRILMLDLRPAKTVAAALPVPAAGFAPSVAATTPTAVIALQSKLK